MSPDEGGQRSPDEGGGRGTTSEGLLAKAEAVVPWAEAEAGSTTAGGLVARRRPRAKNGLPLGPTIQAQGDKAVQKKGRSSLPRATCTEQDDIQGMYHSSCRIKM